MTISWTTDAGVIVSMDITGNQITHLMVNGKSIRAASIVRQNDYYALLIDQIGDERVYLKIPQKTEKKLSEISDSLNLQMY